VKLSDNNEDWMIYEYDPPCLTAAVNAINQLPVVAAAARSGYSTGPVAVFRTALA
jgi:hypothetical protein